MNALSATRRDDPFTYGDYCTWPGDERWELIDGVPYAMAPAPSRFHQGVVGEHRCSGFFTPKHSKRLVFSRQKIFDFDNSDQITHLQIVLYF